MKESAANKLSKNHSFLICLRTLNLRATSIVIIKSSHFNVSCRKYYGASHVQNSRKMTRKQRIIVSSTRRNQFFPLLSAVNPLSPWKLTGAWWHQSVPEYSRDPALTKRCSHVSPLSLLVDPMEFLVWRFPHRVIILFPPRDAPRRSPANFNRTSTQDFQDFAKQIGRRESTR